MCIAKGGEIRCGGDRESSRIKQLRKSSSKGNGLAEWREGKLSVMTSSSIHGVIKLSINRFNHEIMKPDFFLTVGTVTWNNTEGKSVK